MILGACFMYECSPWITEAAIQAKPEIVRFRSQEKSLPNISPMPHGIFHLEMESSRV